MKIPRDIGASELIRALRVLGYESVRQDGSHIRLTTTLDGTHHVTVPNHRPLKTGTLLGGVFETRGRTPQAHRRGIARPTGAVKPTANTGNVEMRNLTPFMTPFKGGKNLALLRGAILALIPPEKFTSLNAAFDQYIVNRTKRKLLVLKKLPPRILVILVVLGNYLFSSSALKADVTITSVPSKIPATPSDAVHYAGQNSEDSPCNGRVLSNNRQKLGTVCELPSRFTITNTSGRGILKISWNGWVSTSSSYSIGAPGDGYRGKTYDVDQVIRWGPSDGPMTTIAKLGDDVVRTNDEIGDFSETERIFIGGLPGKYFSVERPIENGTYNLDNVLIVYNSSGGACMENITLSFLRLPILSNASITSASPGNPAIFSGSVTGGTPNGTAHLEASIDLGRIDPWQAIATITLDASGNGLFTSVKDLRTSATNAPADFFRVSVPP